MRSHLRSLSSVAAAAAVLGWFTPAAADTAVLVLPREGNPNCSQLAANNTPQLSTNNLATGSPLSAGSQTINFTSTGSGLSSWSSTEPVFAVILRQSGPGGGSALQYLYAEPGVISDTDLVGPGSSLNTVTFCYGLPGTPEPPDSTALAPCPLSGDAYGSFCSGFETTGDAFVAFFFNKSSNFLEAGVCTCGVDETKENTESTFGNGLERCSFNINDPNYCFREEDGQLSIIKAFRGIDAYCTTDDPNDESGECSTFCLRGFPSGTSYSCAK